MASVDSNTELLIHSDTTNGSTTFTDSSSNSHTVTEYNNCSHTTSYQKFGTSSIAFDGTDDYLEVADHASLDFGTGDFTIDLWVNIEDFANSPSGNYYHTLVSKGDYTQAGEWELAILYNTDWVGYDTILTFYVGSSLQWQDISTLSADTWYHIAIVRASGVITYYIDGVSKGTDNQAGTMNNTSPLWIGVSEKQPTYGDLNGRLDEIRLSSVARWSSNFTPPTAPYGSETISATSQALTLTQYTATVNTDKDVALAYHSLTLTQYPLAGIVISPTVALSSQALTLTQYVMEVFVGTSVALTSIPLTLTQYAASVIYPWTETLSSQALTLTQYSPTVIIPVTVALNSQSLTLTQYASTTRQVNSAGHVQITTTGIKPLIKTGGNKPIVTTTAGG